MLLMVTLPVLKYTVKFADRNRRRKIVLVGGIILILAVNDLSRNRLAGFSLYRFRGLAGACLITLVGYYLYQAREYFKKRIFLIIAPAVFIVTNILREAVQLHREAAGYVDDKSIMYWYTLFGLIAASCILVFCMALIRDKKATACNRSICYLASYTFPIYLIHLLIKYVFDSVGLTKNLQHSVLTWNSGAAGEAVYLTVIISLLFWCSFFVVFIFRGVVHLVFHGHGGR
jgi:peptidoglycan/LPS O-acetylase OafA/YrhL